MHGLGEVNRVERPHLVPVVREEEPRLLEEGALGVSDEVAGVELHDVRGHVVPRLARAGAAHHEDVEVAVQLRVELRAVQRQPEVLGEDEVVVLVGGVAERLALLEGAPARRTGLFARAVVADEGHVPQPEEPDDHRHAEADEQRRRGDVHMQRLLPDEDPHAGEGVAPVLEELPRI